MPIKIVKQDITKIECDVIVNPTNTGMRPSGGVDEAIHKAAGPELLEYCRGLGKISTGEARITPAFNLPCRFVIHTVGPKWRGGLMGEALLLRSCYEKSLKLAIDNGCASVALPLISSGAYGYPKDRVLREATEVISSMLEEYEIDVYIVIYDKSEFSIDPETYGKVQSFVDFFCDERSTVACITQFETCERSFAKRQICEERITDSDELVDLRDCYRSSSAVTSDVCSIRELNDMLNNMDKGFADTLFYYIDKRKMTDVEAYKKSNVSKKTFSKIKCNNSYRPSKETALSFAIGLHLNMSETKHLLSTAGMCLSRSNKFDVVIEYFITIGKYDTIFDVNEVLYQLDLPLLGV